MMFLILHHHFLKKSQHRCYAREVEFALIRLKTRPFYTNLAQDGTMLLSGWLRVRININNLMYVEYISANDYPPSSAVDTPGIIC